jgi:hypothetical protein
MAIVTGPLMSIDARSAFTDAICLHHLVVGAGMFVYVFIVNR